jgi:hypothetical protein
MATTKELDKTVDMLEGTVFRGRTLVVEEARLQAQAAEDERKARASDGGGGRQGGLMPQRRAPALDKPTRMALRRSLWAGNESSR